MQKINRYSGNYLSYTQIGGRRVTAQEICEELTKWPLDGVLGYLGRISHHMVNGHKSEFLNPTSQADYFNLAISDDFPFPLSGAAKLYIPGKVYVPSDDSIMIHEQNITWLSHLAIIHSKEDRITKELEINLRARVCRLLLISNDISSERVSGGLGLDLISNKNRANRWLMHYQFNNCRTMHAAMWDLARESILFKIAQTKYDIDKYFSLATNGISIQHYFEIASLFFVATYGYKDMPVVWLGDAIFDNLKHHRDWAERILRSWIIKPYQYREQFSSWLRTRGESQYGDTFEFNLLRERPLIEASPGRFICPNVPFLLQKALYEPLEILRRYFEDQNMANIEGKAVDMAYSLAYENYVNDLLRIIAEKDKSGPWRNKENPKTKQHSELADFYMQRDTIACAFEHKSNRPGPEFLRGAPSMRALGPSDEALSRITLSNRIDYKEGRDSDKGFLTRAMWQQSIQGPFLHEWATKRYQKAPECVYPIIVHLSLYLVDPLVRAGYLNGLISSADLYPGTFWQAPQWMHVSDIEYLVSIATKNQEGLDFGKLLSIKSSYYKDHDFRHFVRNHYGLFYIPDKLQQEGMRIMVSAGARFFGADLREQAEAALSGSE